MINERKTFIYQFSKLMLQLYDKKKGNLKIHLYGFQVTFYRDEALMLITQQY